MKQTNKLFNEDKIKKFFSDSFFDALVTLFLQLHLIEMPFWKKQKELIVQSRISSSFPGAPMVSVS